MEQLLATEVGPDFNLLKSGLMHQLPPYGSRGLLARSPIVQFAGQETIKLLVIP
jgi:hypothetical protein